MPVDNKPVRMAPSILAADFTRLGEQVREAEAAGADRIHVDVMDGHFVPNISMGPLVVEALRKITRLPLETHLMISNPDQYLEVFAKAGSTSLLVHVEGNNHLHRTIQSIRGLGLPAGVVLNPATPTWSIEEVIDMVDLVLVMTVNPGFGGQQYLPETEGKIRSLRRLLDQRDRFVELEVDGGITAASAPRAVAAGARVLVAGSSIFGHAGGIAAGLDALVNSVKGTG
ncbi:MAG: ribulose-phosphate 3-epimerase [Planctomycetota bacterium]|nr:ribulose-phosphate 3-epimerase [Planctomycetota bacterium]